MPQPLSKVKFKGQYSITHEAALKRHGLATLASACVCAWSHVEYELSLLVSHLLGENADVSLAMYKVLESDSARKSVLFAAANRALDDHQHLLMPLRAVHKEYETCKKDRNKLAHWVWGYADDLPDALLMADPSDIFDWNIEYHKLQKTRALANALRGEKSSAPPKVPPRNKIFVYWAQDFLDIIKHSQNCMIYLWQIGVCLQKRVPVNDELLRLLCNEPRIRRNIEILSQRDGKNRPKK